MASALMRIDAAIQQKNRVALERVRLQNAWRRFYSISLATFKAHKPKNCVTLEKWTARDLKILKSIMTYVEYDVTKADQILRHGLEHAKTLDWINRARSLSFSNIACNDKLIEYAAQYTPPQKVGVLIEVGNDYIYKGEYLSRVLSLNPCIIIMPGGKKLQANSHDLLPIQDIRWYRFADDIFYDSSGYLEYVTNFCS